MQRYLVNDSFSHLSRAQLIEPLIESGNRHENSLQSVNKQIIRLLDDVEGVARGDLSVRKDTANLFLPEHECYITGAIHDALNYFLDDLCELIAGLPEESPLRKKYKLSTKFDQESK